MRRAGVPGWRGGGVAGYADARLLGDPFKRVSILAWLLLPLTERFAFEDDAPTWNPRFHPWKPQRVTAC